MAAQSNSKEKSLFFAYARRTDHNTFSRYMLTFADRDTAEEWWSMVQQEYPDSIRSNPQLFSFTGDGRPSQIWENKKFEHLKTKWMYTQFGDSKDTRGGAQSTIPVQAGTYSYGGGGGEESGASAGAGASGSLDLKELACVLEKSNKANADQLQASVKPIPEQVQQLAAAQKTSAANLDKLQKIVEQQNAQLAAMSKGSSGGQKGAPSAGGDTEKLQKIIEEQNKQMEEARKSSSIETERLRKMVEQQGKDNQALTSKLGDVATMLDKANQTKPADSSAGSPSTTSSAETERLQKMVEQQSKDNQALTSKLGDLATMLERSSQSKPAPSTTAAPSGKSSEGAERLKEVVEQQSKQIESLTSKLGEVMGAWEKSGHACQCGQTGPSSGQQQNGDHDCGIKPPPRKLNRRVTGYTYT